MMSCFNCTGRINCTTAALVAAAIIGVLTAFLQITGVITVTTTFVAVAFGIAVVYLGILLLRRTAEQTGCCGAVGLLLAGILGTILLALVLLAVGIVATSVVSAILVGLLLFFFALMIAATACFIRCKAGCAT